MSLAEVARKARAQVAGLEHGGPKGNDGYWEEMSANEVAAIITAFENDPGFTLHERIEGLLKKLEATGVRGVAWEQAQVEADRNQDAVFDSPDRFLIDHLRELLEGKK